MKLKTIFYLIGTLLCITLVAVPGKAHATTLAAFNQGPQITSAHIAVQTYPVVTVQPGNTLSELAQRYNLTVEGLYCTNEKIIGPDPNLILPGQVLTMKNSTCGSTATITVTKGREYAAGTPQHIAMALLATLHEQGQFSCLNSIIMGESSWNVHAYNGSSGAYGIPQALPGSKMAGFWGQDWENSAYVQLYWMIKEYIPSTYGTPCGAWAFHEAHGWY